MKPILHVIQIVIVITIVICTDCISWTRRAQENDPVSFTPSRCVLVSMDHSCVSACNDAPSRTQPQRTH